MRRPIHLLLLAIAAGASSSDGYGRAAFAEDPAPALETTHLTRVQPDPEGVDGESLKVAPRSAHVVWRVQREQRWSWVVDGKPGSAYAKVGRLVFSEDGIHWAHFARAEGKPVLIRDGEPLAGPEPEPEEESLRFVPGGSALAFLATRSGKEGTRGTALVVDGVPGPLFPAIAADSVSFSADGKRVAYRASNGAEESIVVDGKAGRPFAPGSLGRPRFSADGTRWACAVTAAGQRLLIDGVEGPVFGTVSPLVFAPTGARYAYVAVREGKPVVIVDGEEQSGAAEIAAPSLVFSADGAHVAYAARRTEGWRVVLDGRDGPPFPRLGSDSLQFSPDGKHLAYWAGKGPKPFYVVDGVPQKAVDLVGADRAARFSPDSRRFAYSARRGGKWVVVTDGADGPETDGILVGFPVFSPDSRHVVYEAQVGGSRHVFVDGKPGPAFDGFAEDSLAFGEDEASVGVVARRGSSWHVVVDGVEGEANDALLPGAALVADGPRSFHAWFLREQAIVHARGALQSSAPR